MNETVTEDENLFVVALLVKNEEIKNAFSPKRTLFHGTKEMNFSEKSPYHSLAMEHWTFFKGHTNC